MEKRAIIQIPNMKRGVKGESEKRQARKSDSLDETGELLERATSCQSSITRVMIAYAENLMEITINTARTNKQI